MKMGVEDPETKEFEIKQTQEENIGDGSIGVHITQSGDSTDNILIM